jgi:aerotaxis receptor
MSTGSPLADPEYVLPEDAVIVIRIDPANRITYANQAFLDSSGYTLDECMGQPQSILRHPDMPQQVFADLWCTIQGGKPWTGMVKSRRRNGGFYWVRANVSPIIDAGQITGYMSVWVKPTARQSSPPSRPTGASPASGAMSSFGKARSSARAGWPASRASCSLE